MNKLINSISMYIFKIQPIEYINIYNVVIVKTNNL